MRFRLRRQWEDGKVEALARSREFGWMPYRDLKVIAPYLGETTVPAGVTLISEGQLNNRFFLLFTGVLEVSEGGRHKAFLHSGETCGSMSREVSTETICTVTPVRLLVSGHDHYRALRHTKTRVPTRTMVPSGA